MMKIAQFMAQLRATGIEFYLDEGQLKSRAEKGKITAEIATQIRSYKTDIIQFLTDEAAQKTTISRSKTRLLPRPLPVTAPVDLSFQQQQLWLIDSLGEGGGEYNISSCFELKGRINIEVFEQAVNAIIMRHQILRTIYRQKDGKLYQQVLSDAAVLMTHIQLNNAETVDVEQRIAELIATERQRPFDLSQDIPCRIGFYQRPMSSPAEDSVQLQSGVLQLIFHHIAVDGWSIQYIFEELKAHYSALLEGKICDLPQPSLQYADYAYWQRQELGNASSEHSLNYWREQLEGVNELHQLSTNPSRPAQKQTRSDLVEGYLPQQMVSPLRQVCAQFGLSAFMLMYGALALVLGRHGNQSDVVIGTPFANRQGSDIADLIGYFVNVLVLRVQTSQGSLNDFFAQVKQTYLDAQQHSQIPFETLVDALQVKRDSAFNPLFQLMLTTDSLLTTQDAATAIQLPGFWLKPYNDKGRDLKFDLEVDLTIKPTGVVLTWLYDVALFERKKIELLNQHVMNVLSYFATATDLSTICLQQIPMLSKTESDTLVYELQGSRVPLSTDIALHQAFERQVDIAPHRIALVQGDVQWNYQTLNEQANRLARFIKEQPDFAAGRLLGVSMPRTPPMIVAILAIIKTGCAYLPLDPYYPQQRLQQMVEDASAPLVLTTTGLAEKSWSQSPLQAKNAILRLDDPQVIDQIEQCLATNLGLDANVFADAYTIFTSGSTGRPKPSVIEHHHAMHLNDWYAREYHFQAHDATLLLSALGFDLTQKNIWTPLRTGGCLVLPETDILEVFTVVQTIASQQVTTLNCTPSVFCELIAQPSMWSKMTSLRMVFLGGEPVPLHRLAAWYASDNCHAQIINMYGPTECTDIATTYKYCGNESILPIGRPMQNVDVFVLDEQGAILPFGIEGELYIGGKGVTRGYLDQPQLSEHKFVRRNIGGISRNLYRTGDIVKWSHTSIDQQPQLFFVGRKDFQVKVRGLRIELNEIESQANALKWVDQSQVLKHDEDTLKMFVILSTAGDKQYTQDQQGVIGSIGQQLSLVLPNYMVPTWIEVLQQWPITANGKIDKKALSAIPLTKQMTSKYGQTKHNAHTPMQKQISELWAQLLNCSASELDIDTSFFELGGHSLRLIQLLSLIDQTLCVQLRAGQVFRQPTIRAIAQCIGNSGQFQRNDIPRRADADYTPVTPGQRRLWFIDRMQGGSSEYNMPFSFLIRGPLSVDAIQQSFQAIIERHAILRTFYEEINGSVAQRVQKQFEFPLEVLNFSMDDDPRARVMTAIKERAERDFQLDRDLMIRASLFSLSSDQAVLLINLHHIASDGWSLELIQQEFFEFYQYFSLNKPLTLTPLPIQYADYAAWLDEAIDNEGESSQLAYWQSQLAGVAPVHQLPLDFERPAHKQFDGGVISEILPANCCQGLSNLATRFAMTPFMLCHGALALLLARYSHSSDIVIGTPHANRDYPQLVGLVGFFVNTLILRTQVKAGTLVDFLRHVKTVNLGAQQAAAMPFDSLVERLNVPRSLAYTPLFQIMLTTTNDYGFGKRQADSDDVSEIQIETFAEIELKAKFDLSVDIHLDDQGGHVEMIYDAALFAGSTVKQMTAHLAALLNGLAQAADIEEHSLSRLQLSDLDMFTPEQSRQLLRSGYPQASVRRNCDDIQLVHHKFEAQVLKTPTAPALVLGAYSMSYQTLNERANQLGHYLHQHHGIESNQFVGVYMTRSFDMVIAILAILKAGGAYVPFDMAHGEAVIDNRIAQQDLAVVLVNDTTRSKLCSSSSMTVQINISEFIATQATDHPKYDAKVTMDAADLLYGMTTSGTTGKPKLIGLPHRAGVNLLNGLANAEAQLAQPQRILQHASIGFDMSFTDLFMALVNGGCVYLIDEAQRYDVAALVRLVADQSITVLNLSSSLLRAFVGEALTLEVDHSALRLIMSTAEPLEVTDKLRDYFMRYPQVTLLNCYGPTETHVCTIKVLENAVEQWPVFPGIGQPILNSHCVALAIDGSPAPSNSVGSLVVAGHCLAMGYINDPMQSAEKFVNAAYLGLDDTRWYHVGDLVRWVDGEFVCLGRMDDEIKIRGHRISLNAIAEVAADLALIERSVALMKDDVLVLYFQPINSTLSMDKVELIEQLKDGMSQSLPQYMVPQQFAIVSQWPLNINGKVNKAALLEYERFKSSQVYRAAQTETEWMMISIWQRLLLVGSKDIGTNDHFFELGGHSLLAVRLIGEIRAHFHFELAIKTVFEHPMLGDLCRQLDIQLVNQKMLEMPADELGDEQWL